MANDYVSLLGPLPSPKTFDFFAYKNKLYSLRREYCNKPRAVTYYISTSGSDANNGLTPSTPKATISAVNTLIAASSGNIEFLFKRGDVWTTNTTLTINQPNITLGDYGDSSLNKPWFNRFAQKYSTGWTLAAGNRYTRAETTDTAWVRFQGWDDSKASIAGKVLSRQTSAANCEATSNSFFWGSNVLHVNLGGTNPNTVLLEGNITSTNAGIVVTADGCYIHDLRVDGFGQDFSNPHTPQAYQINWRQNSGEVGYAYNCETYYGGTHLHATYQVGGGGNITLIEECSAGFAMQGSAGETIFNAYANLGLHETYFVNCIVVAGTLPNGTAAWVRRSQSFYAHTAGGVAPALIIDDGARVLAGPYSCYLLAYYENFTDTFSLDQVRGFHINEDTTGPFYAAFPFKNQAWINCKYDLTPPQMAGQSMFASGLSSQYFAGWMWNCTLKLNLSGQTDTGSRSYYNSLSTNNNCHLWHNTFTFLTASTTAFRYDFDTQSTNSSPDCEFFNNVYQANTAAVVSVGLNNTSANLKHNAYFNIVGGSDFSTRTAYGNDAGRIDLSDIVSPDTYNYVNSLSRKGITTIGLEYDSNMRPRPTDACSSIAPTIGPVDYTYLVDVGFTGKQVSPHSRICNYV